MAHSDDMARGVATTLGMARAHHSVGRSGMVGGAGASVGAVTCDGRRRRLRWCHDADVVHSVRARKSLPATLDRIALISFTHDHFASST